MLRLTIAASVIAAATLVAVPAAQAKDRTTICESAYGVRTAVIKKHGKRAPGRNICRHGIKTKTGARKATTRERAKYKRALKQLNSVYVQAGPPRRPPAGTQTAQPLRAGGPERFVQCESGGDWNAVNPSSGAYGRYQLMPMHFGSGGLCAGESRDPAGQTRCANKVYAAQGSGAWSQCGG